MNYLCQFGTCKEFFYIFLVIDHITIFRICYVMIIVQLLEGIGIKIITLNLPL